MGFQREFLRTSVIKRESVAGVIDFNEYPKTTVRLRFCHAWAIKRWVKRGVWPDRVAVRVAC